MGTDSASSCRRPVPISGKRKSYLSRTYFQKRQHRSQVTAVLANTWSESDRDRPYANSGCRLELTRVDSIGNVPKAIPDAKVDGSIHTACGTIRQRDLNDISVRPTGSFVVVLLIRRKQS